MCSPRISVIIPVYNVACYIEDCLQSVLEQDYNNMEIIVVDDCGTDDSMDIVENFVRVHACHIKILHHTKNRGLSAARNTGVKHSTGEYLFFLDSDDVLCPDAIRCFIRYMKEYGHADFFVGNCIVEGTFPAIRLTTPPVLEGRENILSCFCREEWYMMAWGKLVSRKFFIDNNLWFAEGRLHEDYFFSFCLALSANKMITVQEPVYKYIIRENSITTAKKRKNYIDQFWTLEQIISLVKMNGGIFPDGTGKSYIITSLFTNAILVSGSQLPYQQKCILLKWTREQMNAVECAGISLKYKIKFWILSFPNPVVMRICRFFS